MTEAGTVETELRQEAKRICTDVQADRIELPDGETGWIGYDLKKHDASDRLLMIRGQKGLYCGQLGVATFFAAMYEVFGDETYRQQAHEAIDFLLQEDVDELTEDVGLGVGSGYGSLVYGLSVVADLTGNRQYRDRAREFVRSLTETKIRLDDEYDVLLGTAGALLALLAYYERTDEEDALDRAVLCGEHLLENRHDKWGYQVWETHWSDSFQSFTTGMGHGAAGISYALYRLYGHTGRPEFRDAADDALGFENVFYSETNSNWRANWASIPHYPQWWCYGVPGIGLARLGSLQYHESETLERDLRRARGFDPRLGSKDEICHGTFSQVDFLVELGRRFDESYVDRATELAAEAMERTRQTGGYRVVGGRTEGIYNPIFFLGTAGIGYTLLRLLEPESLPSICRFE